MSALQALCKIYSLNLLSFGKCTNNLNLNFQKSNGFNTMRDHNTDIKIELWFDLVVNQSNN